MAKKISFPMGNGEIKNGYFNGTSIPQAIQQNIECLLDGEGGGGGGRGRSNSEWNEQKTNSFLFL